MMEKFLEQTKSEEIRNLGVEINICWACDVKELKDESSINILTLSIIEAFKASGYAIDKPNFTPMAIDFFIKGDNTLTDNLKEFAGRFGEERLKDGLIGWKILQDKVINSAHLEDCSAKEISDFQLKTYNTAVNLKHKGEIYGIGAWLFNFPFKIIALYRSELWGEEDFNKIVMPSGFQVVKGLRRLKKESYTLLKDKNIEEMSENENGLEDGVSDNYMLQDISKKMAEIAHTNVLHINSGLYKYGQKAEEQE